MCESVWKRPPFKHGPNDDNIKRELSLSAILIRSKIYPTGINKSGATLRETTIEGASN